MLITTSINHKTVELMFLSVAVMLIRHKYNFHCNKVQIPCFDGWKVVICSYSKQRSTSGLPGLSSMQSEESCRSLTDQ